MDLQRLLMLQEELEAIIMQRCERKGKIIADDERVKSMIVELYAEVGEFTNELSIHKYWKHNKKVDEDKVLKELADIYMSLFAVTNLLDYQASDITKTIIANYGVGVQRQKNGY